ncbi:Uncharacterised protein [Mycobacteroides abscessus subsp. abscessus]|nr:Uncharacterised protein [Mycobacteroides abscessus subsp. abscessus]
MPPLAFTAAAVLSNNVEPVVSVLRNAVSSPTATVRIRSKSVASSG